MIVYNVQRCWFTMKNDAEAHRKTLGLPPAATFTLRIDTREELSGLLNGLCGIRPNTAELMALCEVAPPEVIGRNLVDAPDCVPLFLIKRDGA